MIQLFLICSSKNFELSFVSMGLPITMFSLALLNCMSDPHLGEAQFSKICSLDSSQTSPVGLHTISSHRNLSVFWCWCKSLVLRFISSLPALTTYVLPNHPLRYLWLGTRVFGMMIDTGVIQLYKSHNAIMTQVLISTVLCQTKHCNV